MRVITYATRKEQYYDALEQSCKKFNYDLITLGLGNKWNGMGDKILNINNYLKVQDDQEEIIIIVDAYDVIFCRNSEEMINHLPENEVLFNSESLSKSYLINKNYQKFYGDIDMYTTNKYNKLNAGCIIGKIKLISEIYSIIEKEYNIKEKKLSSDQQAIYLLSREKKIPDFVKLDYKNEIFTVLTGYNNDIIEKGNKIYNNYTKTYPFLIHGAGNNVDMNRYIKVNGLKTNYKQFFTSTDKISIFFKNNLDYIVIFSVFILLFFLYNMTKGKLKAF